MIKRAEQLVRRQALIEDEFIVQGAGQGVMTTLADVKRLSYADYSGRFIFEEISDDPVVFYEDVEEYDEPEPALLTLSEPTDTTSGRASSAVEEEHHEAEVAADMATASETEPLEPFACIEEEEEYEQDDPLVVEAARAFVGGKIEQAVAKVAEQRLAE